MKQDDIKDLPNLGDYNYENIFSIYTDENGMYYYNLLNAINFPTELSPNLYFEGILEHGAVWTNMAYKIYGTIKLWWIICAVNQINNPLVMPPAGTKLKFLTPTAVGEVLKKLNING